MENRSFDHMLGWVPGADGRRQTRLDLAKWLVGPEHPLTARVTVNRFWQQCFGQGIVKTSGDFGNQGDLPTHPELLDWLAVEFQDRGWSMKQMHKLIMLSNAYESSSTADPVMLKKDPQDVEVLYARGEVYRRSAPHQRQRRCERPSTHPTPRPAGPQARRTSTTGPPPAGRNSSAAPPRHRWQDR